MAKHTLQVIKYYQNFESLKGYSWLLKGDKHFGYYTTKTNSISMRQAMVNMQDQLAKRLQLPAQSLVLDAGCGQGTVSLLLAREYNLNVVGIDLLDFNIAQAKSSTKPSDTVEFYIADYNRTGFQTASFDAVFTLEALVHSSDFEATLREFKRILKPGGKLVLFEYSHEPYPNLSERVINFYKVMNKYAAMPAFDKFEHGILAKSLRNQGFKEVQEENITEFILPTLRRFRQLALLPYQIVRLLRLQCNFINTHAGWGLYKYRNTFRYSIYTAIKPKH